MTKAIERRLADLERRVEQLEGGPASGPKAPTTTGLSLVEQLRAQGGGLTYAGAVVQEGSEFLWIRQHDVEEVRGTDPATIATVLGSLGSPARLALLTSLVAGPRSRPELQDALGESSTGQLYHHLRDLQAAGLIHQPKRGRYELAAHTVVPLLTILAAAGDIGVLEP